MNDFIYIHLPNGRDLKIARRWANRQTGKELLGIGFTWNFVSKYIWNTIHIERYFGLFLPVKSLKWIKCPPKWFLFDIKDSLSMPINDLERKLFNLTRPPFKGSWPANIK